MKEYALSEYGGGFTPELFKAIHRHAVECGKVVKHVVYVADPLLYPLYKASLILISEPTSPDAYPYDDTSRVLLLASATTFSWFGMTVKFIPAVPTPATPPMYADRNIIEVYYV